MAERRMFAKTIIDSDSFLDMALSTQALYFHLSMRADDDGFINSPKKISKMIGASDDEMKILMAKKFIIGFESGIVVIKHWKIHNYIQKDRYKPTNYTEEKAQLGQKDNYVYTLDTECIQDVHVGKDRLGEVSEGKDRLELGKANIVKPFSFTLTRQCLLSSTSKEYQEELALYISASTHVMSYEDFYNQCEMKPYKYKNFKMAYDSWNKKANTSNMPFNTPKMQQLNPDVNIWDEIDKMPNEPQGQLNG